MNQIEEVPNKISVEMIFSNGLFQNAEDFSIYIEKTAVETGERYLHTILDYCQENEIDPDLVSKSLSPSLKEKLQAECERFNLLKTKSPKLPE